MSKEIHHELKKEFQLERLILFSDAVFAIAITLLVIEIKVPEISDELLSEHALTQSLWHIFPKFMGFLVSFLIIGLYWTVHHRMFGYVVAYTQRLLWINLFFLMAVALMPFSSAFYSEYISHLYRSPAMLYVANISFLGIMNFILWKYITNPKHKLTEGLTQPLARYYSFRAIAVPIIFFIMGIVYFFAPKFAIIIPMIIPIVMRIVFGRMRKKLGAELN
jgi:uncharacterized membrane protein